MFPSRQLDRIKGLILHIFIILIIIISLNCSENEVLGIQVHYYKYNDSLNTQSHDLFSDLCKVHNPHDMSCMRPLCPIKPSQPGCPPQPEPTANVSAFKDLENMTKH